MRPTALGETATGWLITQRFRVPWFPRRSLKLCSTVVRRLSRPRRCAVGRGRALTATAPPRTGLYRRGESYVPTCDGEVGPLLRLPAGSLPGGRHSCQMTTVLMTTVTTVDPSTTPATALKCTYRAWLRHLPAPGRLRRFDALRPARPPGMNRGCLEVIGCSREPLNYEVLPGFEQPCHTRLRYRKTPIAAAELPPRGRQERV